MNIYDAITLFRFPHATYTRFSSPQEIAQSRNDWEVRQKAEELLQSYETYRFMTVKEGRAVAKAALEMFDIGIAGTQFEYVPHHILMNIAKLVPDALDALYEDIIARNLFWGDGVTFRGADPAIRDMLLNLLENNRPKVWEFDDLLTSLAWIDDNVVHNVFRRWQHHTPSWYTATHYPIENHTQYAGWELTTDDHPRYLYHRECYALVPADTGEDTDVPGPVSVFMHLEEKCQWCSRPLIAFFDCDLRDSRLAFLDTRRQHLCIPFCINCSLQGEHVFMDIDAEGNGRWSATPQKQPPMLNLNLYGDDEPKAERPLLLGPSRNPYETIAQYWDDGLSQIGGHPEWVQYPEYPHCPTCQRTMKCIGQLGLTDIQPGTEGMMYAFFCSDCGKATTGYQQT